MMKFSLALLAVTFVLAACGDDDDDAPQEASPEEVEEAIADDLEGLADALAAGNYERVYDDFLTGACQSRVSRDEYLRLLRESAGALEDLRVEVDNVELLSQESAQQAEVRVDFNLIRDGMAVPRDPDAAPELRDLVFEDDHWRSEDCFGLSARTSGADGLL